jgi:hypothetical protein
LGSRVCGLRQALCRARGLGVSGGWVRRYCRGCVSTTPPSLCCWQSTQGEQSMSQHWFSKHHGVLLEVLLKLVACLSHTDCSEPVLLTSTA